jgi:hypothetical protein
MPNLIGPVPYLGPAVVGKRKLGTEAKGPLYSREGLATSSSTVVLGALDNVQEGVQLRLARLETWWLGLGCVASWCISAGARRCRKLMA